jgi:hypothetical protein
MRTQAQQDFTTMLVTAFPDLRQEIEDSDGQLLYEMDAFAAYTQSAKMSGDWPVYEQCIQVADQVLVSPDAGLVSALRTSYLEHLDFEGSRGPDAWRRLSPPLQNAWEQIAATNRRLMALPQKGSRGRDPASHQGNQGHPGHQGHGPRKKKPSSRKNSRGRRR